MTEIKPLALTTHELLRLFSAELENRGDLASAIRWGADAPTSGVNTRGSAEWTNALLNLLLDLGRERCKTVWPNKYYLFCEGKGRRRNRKYLRGDDRGEFLVDAAWTTYASDADWFHAATIADAPPRLLLACESEWASRSRTGAHFLRELMDDFAKLAVLDAPLKVFIFSYHEPYEVTFDRVVELCRKLAPRHAGTEYLLLGWPWTAEWGGRMSFRAEHL
jgi:hypothetical protein